MSLGQVWHLNHSFLSPQQGCHPLLVSQCSWTLLGVWAPPELEFHTPSLTGCEASSKNSVWKSHAEAPEEDNYGKSSGSGRYHHPGGPPCHHGNTESLPEVQRQTNCCSVMGFSQDPVPTPLTVLP